MLTFDPIAHQYFYDGVPVVNVTRVLAPLVDLSMVNREQLEIARQKGVAVHRMVELDAKGDLDEATLPEWMAPVLVEWRKFVSQSGFKVIDSEKKVYHPLMRYAGTLDLFGLMNNGPVYIDVKRSFFAGKVTGLQLAGYRAADSHEHKDRRNAKRFALRLKEGEPFRLEEFTDANDFGVFTAALTIFNFRAKNGM